MEILIKGRVRTCYDNPCKGIVDRKSRYPHLWSNSELRKIAPKFRGAVINLSAWRDEDKAGGHYPDYFTSASSYSISNWLGTRGNEKTGSGMLLNLEQPLAEDLAGTYDVVFNHTTFEHVFDIFLAFENLCRLSRDVVIIVVPFLQEAHFSDSYTDYWRFTPFTLRKLFERNAMDVIYESISPDEENTSIYVMSVGSKKTPNWAGVLPDGKLTDVFYGSNIVRNDPFTLLATKTYRWLNRLGLYRRYSK